MILTGMSARHFVFGTWRRPEVIVYSPSFQWNSQENAMQIAMIGAGNVGGALGTRWAEKGHSIKYAVRNPKADKVQKLIASLKGRAQAATIAEATTNAEVVVLATPWEGARDALAAAGNLAGKILIDATNPIGLGMEGL